MLNTGESAFLVLCEELNFTRAAERCYITQQGLSAHIRKLEEAYSTQTDTVTTCRARSLLRPG